MTYNTEVVQLLLASAALLALGSAVRAWVAPAGKMKKVMVTTYVVGVFTFGISAAFGSPSGEADMTFQDGQRTVLSVAVTTGNNAVTYYNLLLAEEKVEDTRYHKISADMVTVIGVVKENNCHTFSVVAKQGLRKATLDCSTMGG